MFWKPCDAYRRRPDPAGGSMPNDSTSIPDVLQRICANKRMEVAVRKSKAPVEILRQKIAARADRPRGFGAALKDATVRGKYGLIAEIKKASPSGGLIRPDFDPAVLARAYRDGGAACLSVLREEQYFQGTAQHFLAARAAVELLVLRKDFILDPWQIYESRAMGADCILLILAALDDAQATDLEAIAVDLGMDALAEVHNHEELHRALRLRTPLIGINNRDLKTLKTDLSTTENLAATLPS